jgi:hypothetical protein
MSFKEKSEELRANVYYQTYLYQPSYLLCLVLLSCLWIQVIFFLQLSSALTWSPLLVVVTCVKFLCYRPEVFQKHIFSQLDEERRKVCIYIVLIIAPFSVLGLFFTM